MAQCAPTVKKLSLELGGNAPFIVFDDADLEAAVEGAMASKYRNTGQTCVCANRFLVQASVYERFAALLTERVNELKVADGREAGATQGPLIDEAALRKVEAHVADARAKGGRDPDRRRRARAGRDLLRADGDRRRDARHAVRAGGDLRARRAAGALRHRGGGDPAGQRHDLRPRRRTSTRATSAGSGASARRSSTASSASTPA